ncbi:MAG: 3-methyl-2-indolic acid synthase [Desmonostoc vinosum HA7617-LM4]|jgi:3-methyl-2-indolic acid synthase|nr:3-methyl-2-indolic acid synthase [Desmonostoc vinosum HA7617-LM4]
MSQQHYALPEIETVKATSASFSTTALINLLEDEAYIADDPATKAAQALALFNCDSISIESIMKRATVRVGAVAIEKETFVPIFVTNYCQSECKMCGMRQGNSKLIRKFSGKKKIEEQLAILREVDGVSGVGFLTGEYQDKFTRYTNAFFTGWAINTALQLGFEKIFFNIGSMTPDEIEVMSEWLPQGEEKITMCVFQETYNLEKYKKFMGEDSGEIPKADFWRRIDSFDNWLDAGFRTVNPGFLVGLHDSQEELVNILLHVEHLTSRGAKIYVSLPRLRPALGASNRTVVSDSTYIRLIATVAYFTPQSGIVLTTREDMEFQDKVMPFARTLSPGSPDVTPYRWQEEAPNDEHSSQFLIPDHRRPKDILKRLADNGYKFKYFEPKQLTRIPVVK